MCRSRWHLSPGTLSPFSARPGGQGLGDGLRSLDWADDLEPFAGGVGAADLMAAYRSPARLGTAAGAALPGAGDRDLAAQPDLPGCSGFADADFAV